MVDDLNNGGELAILGSSIDKHDAADLNESPGGSFDLVSSSVPILRLSVLRAMLNPYLSVSHFEIVERAIGDLGVEEG